MSSVSIKKLFLMNVTIKRQRPSWPAYPDQHIAIQGKFFCRFEDAVQVSEYSHGQLHIFVLVRSVRTAQQIGHRPDETDFIAKIIPAHHVSFKGVWIMYSRLHADRFLAVPIPASWQCIPGQPSIYLEVTS